MLCRTAITRCLPALLIVSLAAWLGCARQEVSQEEYRFNEAVRGADSAPETPTHLIQQNEGRQTILATAEPPIQAGEERFQLYIEDMETHEPASYNQLSARIFNPVNPDGTTEQVAIVETEKPGLYEVQTRFPEGGTWRLVITEEPSQEEVAIFDLKVLSQPG